MHKGGTVVVTSIWEKPVTFDLNSLVIPEKKKQVKILVSANPDEIAQ